MKHPAALLPVCLLAAFLAGPAPLFSLGDPEAGEYQPVEGLENWDHTLDVSGYEEGKYNLIIRGTDAAGNLRYQGPYNIYVDPASDLPRLRISNPIQGMRVGGGLNVVGACLDDDGVQQVQIRLDGGEPRTAEGGQFWSLPLDLEGIADGEHTIEAWGVDINGNSGQPQSVSFRLDRRAPIIEITSHQSGALVSGTIVLSGRVTDANGIRTVGYGRQREASYEALKLSRDKEEDQYRYELKIDTGELADGPQVFWFRAEDNTGSPAYLAFLLFVNNEEPLLQVLFPQSEQTVEGRLMVVGKASDRIGLRSLSYETEAGERGEIELHPGNPFWTQEFDLTGRKAGAFQISFFLENLTGNRATEKLKVRLDPERDLPQVVIAAPQEQSQTKSDIAVAGYITDDDGGKAVQYSVDGAPPVTVAAADAFRFDLQGLAPGRHTLSIRAEDIHGTLGNETRTQFTVAGQAPRVSLTGVADGEAVEEYRLGMVVPVDRKVKLLGAIRLYGSPVTAEYSLQGGEFKRLASRKGPDAETQLFEIPLGKELAPGRLDVLIRCQDEFGGTGDFAGTLFAGSAPQEGSEILFEGAGLKDSSVLLVDGEPLFGYVPGGAAGPVVLDPPTNLVNARTDGTLVRIEAEAAGVSEPLRLTVSTSGGRTLVSPPLRFVTDLQPPQISVSEPAAGAWFSDSLTVSGSVSDPSGLRSLEVALGEGSPFAEVEMSETEGAVSFSAILSAASVQEGPVLLILKAEDEAGNVAEQRIPLYRDATAPAITLFAPGPEDELNGQITLAGTVEDAGRVVRVELVGEEDGRQIGSGTSFRYDVNLSGWDSLPQGFRLKAVDAAGNEGFLVPPLTLNPEADKPKVEIQIPGAGELIKNDFIISGMVFDDDQVGAIRYSLDGGEFRELPAGNNFSIPLTLESLSDNEHTVEVRAEDIGGLSGPAATSTFMVSTSEPRSTLYEPLISQHVRGVIELKGESEDPNGIDQVFLSFDNGHSFQLVQGSAQSAQSEQSEQWSYRLDTTLLADGTQAVLIKAVDSTGTEGLFTTTINIDNGAPRIVLDSPSDGQMFTRSLPMDGRAFDDIGLSALKARLAPEGGVGTAAGAMEFALQTDGTIVEQLDIETLPAGWYNLSVEAEDAAGNRSYLSRNIQIRQSREAERLDLMFPADGAEIAGNFTVSGRVVLHERAVGVALLLDGELLETVEVDAKGYFALQLGPERVAEGSHTLQIRAGLPAGSTAAVGSPAAAAEAAEPAEPPAEAPAETTAQRPPADAGAGGELLSEPRRIAYRRSGPWVQFTSHATGAFITGRPFLEGRAGFLLEEAASGERTDKEIKRALADHAVEKVEISFDNGGSFHRADGKESWRYRLETQEMANGPLRILVRAIFADGQTAVAHTQLQVDTQPPELALLSPQEGGRFNQQISLRGTASDETGLESVEVSLREGDKSRYGVPKFIQGMYLDVHAMGATYADVGLGLSFFDDNVKLQVQAGMSPEGRFSGLVVGAKLLANVATVPFGYFFGPSWDFFSMSLALGANFSYFTMSEDGIAFGDEGLVMAAVVTQLEFARFEVQKWRFFSSYSLYSELQLWFISSDVQAGAAARISFGFRMGLL